jgi:hypothetical protein
MTDEEFVAFRAALAQQIEEYKTVMDNPEYGGDLTDWIADWVRRTYPAANLVRVHDELVVEL